MRIHNHFNLQVKFFVFLLFFGVGRTYTQNGFVEVGKEQSSFSEVNNQTKSQQRSTRSLQNVFPGAGWGTRKPAQVGLYESKLDQFISNVGGRGCIVRFGYMVKSWGGDPAVRADWASCRKTVTSLMLLFAVYEGKLSSVDALVDPVVQSLFGQQLIQKDRTMTFRHLANMVSGYALPENPGTAWSYNNYGISLYNQTLFNGVFADTPNTVITDPNRLGALQFEDGSVFSSRNGYGLYTSPRDFARIGWFMLNKGNWDGNQLLPAYFFDDFIRIGVQENLPRSTGNTPNDYLGVGSNGGGVNQTPYGPGIYGFNWWFNGYVGTSGNLMWPDAPSDIYQANGHWNQETLTIFPSDSMVITVLGNLGSWEPGNSQSSANQNLKLLKDAIIVNNPSINDPPVVADIPDQTISEGNSFATIRLDSFVFDPDNPDNEINWTSGGNTDLTVNIDIERTAIIVIPDSNWNGSETITFTAIDPGGLSDSDDAKFTVTSVNDPPVVSDIPNQTVPEGGSFNTINLDNYIIDPDDPDDKISWSYSGNTDLTVSIGSSRLSTISIPGSNWNGSETITFTATDPGGLSDSDDAKFTVTSVNDPPMAVNDSATTIEDTPVIIDVLANDTDIENDPLFISLVSQGNNGNVSINPDSTVTYDPAADYHGSDQFSYIVNDGNGGLDTGQVFVIVALAPNISGDVDYAITGSALANTLLQLTGGATISDTSNASGYYEFPDLTSGLNYTVTPSKIGGFGSFTIDFFDASLISRYVVELIVLDPNQQRAADVDRNSAIQFFDAANVARYAVGLPPLVGTFVGEWNFDPVNRSYNPLTNDANDQDFSAFLLGDVDGNYPSAANGFTELGREGEDFSYLTKLEAVSGKELLLPIVIPDNTGLFSAYIELEYPTEVLTLNGISLTEDSQDFKLVVNPAHSGLLRAGLYGIEPIDEAATIAEISFMVKGPTGSSGEISFLHFQINDNPSQQQQVNFRVHPVNETVVTSYDLFQNYPNPFNPTTTITYQLANTEPQHTTLRIYNISGQLVRTLIDEKQNNGKYMVSWNGLNDQGHVTSSGIYFYQLKSGNFIQTHKLFLMK